MYNSYGVLYAHNNHSGIFYYPHADWVNLFFSSKGGNEDFRSLKL